MHQDPGSGTLCRKSQHLGFLGFHAPLTVAQGRSSGPALAMRQLDTDAWSIFM